MFTLGGFTLLLWGVRFSFFRFDESPRYLIGRGRDEQAVAIIRKIAEFNGKADRCTLTVEDLQKAGQEDPTKASPGHGGRLAATVPEVTDVEKERGYSSISSRFSGSHVKPLFATKKMAWSTSLLIVIWGTIGLASTLYNSFLPYMWVFCPIFMGLV